MKIWTLVVICLLVSAMSAHAADATDTPPAKRVLLLSSFSRDFAPGSIMTPVFRTELAKQSATPIDFLDVSLQTTLFAGAGTETPLVEYLRGLFSNKPPDLVLAVGAPALNFLRQHKLFASVPVLVMGADQRRLRLPDPIGNAAAVGITLDLPGLVDNILRVLPNTSTIEVILGNSPQEKFWLAQFHRDFERFTDRVRFDWMSDLSFEEILRRSARLPGDSAILFNLMLVDAAGVPYEQERTLDVLRQESNAPIFGTFDSHLGRGIVGGPLYPFQEVGRVSAAIALRILNGEPPASIEPVFFGPAPPVYDWRELTRWKIDESRLPPGSIVRFRQPSVWAQYRWAILGALAIIVLQAASILGLLLQRARRRRAQAELRESQEFMELSTNAGELGLWVRDLERGDLWANQRLRSMFGFGEHDVLRFDDVLAHIHPDDRARVVSLLQQEQVNDSLFEADFRILSNGTERWIAAKGGSVREAPGHGRRRMGVVTDVTARKKAELEAQRHRDELAHAGRVSVMGQLASALAHELNQPLGAILRNAEAAELFLQGIPPDLQEVRGILADIRKDDQRAGEVIDRMRALLKRREFQWSEMDLNALVEEVASLVRPDAERRRLKLVLDLAPALLPIRGDRVQLQQVLLNLLLNAMDATTSNAPEDRHIIVCTRYFDGQAEVVVTDAGHGIAPEILEHVFEPFFTTKANGMGLGLAISHNIIEAHRGHIRAENSPNGGATFRITLPIRVASEEWQVAGGAET